MRVYPYNNNTAILLIIVSDRQSALNINIKIYDNNISTDKQTDSGLFVCQELLWYTYVEINIIYA